MESRLMPSNVQKITELEEELKKTKYNKKTQHHIGMVKAKIAFLREKETRRASSSGATDGYSVKKTGDATAIIIGLPSVGKSTLLNMLTNAKSKVAPYAFTTLTVIPGLLDYKGAKIQILDVPGIVEGASTGRGRGREVLSCAQSSDLVILLVDVFDPESISVLNQEAHGANLRINVRKPFVMIEKTGRGGVNVGSTLKLTRTDEQTISDVAKELKIMNANILIRDDISVDEFIDVYEGGKRYIPGITILNKIDLITKDELSLIREKIKPDICISAEQGIGIEELKELIFRKMRFIRVFCKRIGKKADMSEPMILQEGATLNTMCEKLHREFINKFKYAKIWGSTKFPGQSIRKLDYKLRDMDIVELRMK